MRLILYSSIILLARAYDPCQELCDWDGITVCIGGSKIVTFSDGYEICSNYFYADYVVVYMPDIFVAEDYQLVPARVEDIPGAIAGRELMRASGSLRIESILHIHREDGKLSKYFIIHALRRLYLAGKLSAPRTFDPIDTWKFLGGPEVIKLVRKVATGGQADLAAILPFALAASMKYSSSPDFEAVVGLSRVCNIWHRELSVSIRTILNTDVGTEKPSLGLLEAIKSARRVCPRLMDKPGFHEAILSVGTRTSSKVGSPLRIKMEIYDFALNNSVASLNEAPIETLRNSILGEDILIKVDEYLYASQISLCRMWLSHVGLDIAAGGFLRLTEDESEIELNRARYRAIGRLLGIIVASRTPTWMGEIPGELLTPLEGQGHPVRSPSNWDIIVSEFHKIVPARLFNDSLWQPQYLEQVLTGPKRFPVEALLRSLTTAPLRGIQGRVWPVPDLIRKIVSEFSDAEIRRLFLKLSDMTTVPSGGFADIGFCGFVLKNMTSAKNVRISGNIFSPMRNLEVGANFDLPTLRAALIDEIMKP